MTSRGNQNGQRCRSTPLAGLSAREVVIAEQSAAAGGDCGQCWKPGPSSCARCLAVEGAKKGRGVGYLFARLHPFGCLCAATNKRVSVLANPLSDAMPAVRCASLAVWVQLGRDRLPTGSGMGHGAGDRRDVRGLAMPRDAKAAGAGAFLDPMDASSLPQASIGGSGEGSRKPASAGPMPDGTATAGP